MKKQFLIFAAFSVLLLLYSCSMQAGLNKGSASLAISTESRAISDAATAEITLSMAGEQSSMQTISLSGGEGTANFTDLAEGTWTVAIDVFNASEELIASGGGTVTVVAGESATGNFKVLMDVTLTDLTVENALTGYVIDAKTEHVPILEDSTTEGTVDDVVVKLYSLDADPETDNPLATGTTANGSYTLSNYDESVEIPADYYLLTGSKAGYIVLERVVLIADDDPVSGTIELPRLYAMPYDAENGYDEYTVNIILTWNNEVKDLDAHLTYPDGDKTTADAPAFTSPFDIPTGVEDGFWNNTATGREHISYNQMLSTNTLGDILGVTDAWQNEACVKLFRDDGYGAAPAYSNDGYGPETISIRRFPFEDDASNVSSNGGENTGLPSGSSYTWVGVMEYYVDAFTPPSADTSYLSTADGGVSAEAVISVYQGSNLMGEFRIPENTDIETASVLRINMFYDEAKTEIYQILSDIQALQDPDIQIRSVSAPQAIVIKGRKVQ